MTGAASWTIGLPDSERGSASDAVGIESEFTSMGSTLGRLAPSAGTGTPGGSIVLTISLQFSPLSFSIVARTDFDQLSPLSAPSVPQTIASKYC
nr:hypothetical protein Iba_chr13cCG9410 [Ipomoea batatas]